MSDAAARTTNALGSDEPLVPVVMGSELQPARTITLIVAIRKDLIDNLLNLFEFLNLRYLNYFISLRASNRCS